MASGPVGKCGMVSSLFRDSHKSMNRESHGMQHQKNPNAAPDEAAVRPFCAPVTRSGFRVSRPVTPRRSKRDCDRNPARTRTFLCPNPGRLFFSPSSAGAGVIADGLAPVQRVRAAVSRHAEVSPHRRPSVSASRQYPPRSHTRLMSGPLDLSNPFNGSPRRSRLWDANAAGLLTQFVKNLGQHS